MMLSQVLLCCPRLISFAFTSLPVHCVPLLTSTSFGFQHERKSSKGSVLSPISALSLETNIPTVNVMLKLNPSSKLSQNQTILLTVRSRLLELLCVFNCSHYFSSCKTACDPHLCVSEWGERERVQMKLQWFNFLPSGMCILVACNS